MRRTLLSLALLTTAAVAFGGGGSRDWMPGAFSPPAAIDARAAAAADIPVLSAAEAAALPASAEPAAVAPAVAPAAAALEQAAPAMTAALVLTPEGQPAETRSVHALGWDGERFYVNGKPAEALEPARGRGEVVEHRLAHPEDPALAVTIYRSRGSLASFDRKTEAVERLAPLAAAGAAPRLVEHGEAVLPQEGVVHFTVQEAVMGKSLAGLPAAKRQGKEVARLFQRLEKAGLALAVPGPSAEWLLRHVVVGRTSSGRGAYVVDAVAEPMAAEPLAAHNALLKSLLTPAAQEPAPATEAKPEPEPVPEPEPELKDDPSVTSDGLEATARSLVAGQSVAEDTARLFAGLELAPKKATPALLGTLREGVSDYWTVLADREKKQVYEGSGYGGHYVTRTKPLDEKHMLRLSDGRTVGAESYSARLDAYRKALELRPDLAEPADAELLRAAFGTPLFGDAPQSDEVFVSELAKLAPAAEALAARRPDLLTIADYASFVAGAAKIAPKRYDGWARANATFRDAVARLRKTMDEGLERLAMTSPVDALKLATTRFAGGRWQAEEGLEDVVERLAQARPDFAAALLDQTIAPAQNAAGAAPAGWSEPVLHNLPFNVTDKKTFDAALVHAEAGWQAYHKAFKAAGEGKILSEKRFYIEVFALGQLFGTKTALGPKVSLAKAGEDARRIATAYFHGAKLGSVLEAIEAIQEHYAKSSNHARKRLQELLLEASLRPDDAPLDGNLVGRAVGDPREFRYLHQGRILASLQNTIPQVLKDLDAGSPSNVAGVLLTGSFAYDAAGPGSDLDLFILTRPGRDRVKELVDRLHALARKNNWPAFSIAEYNVLPADSERVRWLRRGFPNVVYSLDAKLAKAPKLSERYDAPSMLDSLRHRRGRQRFVEALERRLGLVSHY